MSRSPFFVGLALTTPIAYVTLALLMAGDRPENSVRIVIGAGVMGAWSATLFGAGEALYMQRWTGTLELLVSSPRSLLAPVAGFSVATVTLGAYAIVASFVWGALVFGVRFDSVDLWGVAATLVVVLIGLSAVGMVLAAFYVLSRQALTVSNIFEYPIWIASGVLVPASALWPAVAALGLMMPLGWGMAAVDNAMQGAPYGMELFVSVGMSVVYFVLAVVLLARVERRARIDGTLSLR